MDDILIKNPGITGYDRITAYLKKIDTIFPVPMSSRVDIEAHARKVLSRGVVFTAEINGNIVGILLGYANDQLNGCGYLGTLGVSEAYRNMKIGARLVRRMKEYSREQGMHMLVVHAHRDNTKALRFYRNNGFAETDEDNKPYPESVCFVSSL